MFSFLKKISSGRQQNWAFRSGIRINSGTWRRAYLRKEFGVELARIILGHSTAFTTEIYAEVDRKKAMDAMNQVG